MKNKNCPNCGAPIDIERSKCAYCGTSYYDLSLMPLCEPFFLRVNVGTKEKPKIIFAKVKCNYINVIYQQDDIEFEMNFHALSGMTYQES